MIRIIVVKIHVLIFDNDLSILIVKVLTYFHLMVCIQSLKW